LTTSWLAAPAPRSPEQGKVWLPEAPRVRDWLPEVLQFPSGPYADRADCLSYAAILAHRQGTREPTKAPLPAEQERLKRMHDFLWTIKDE
jgi:hypothetical protein